MPVKIPDALPATRILAQENIFVMTERRSASQDIRPLKIAILNLMPTKEATETQLLRLIGNTPLQVEITLLRTASYASTNTSQTHLDTFYKTFDEARNELYDGFIITGAPVELMDFEDVRYWDELRMIMDWADRNVYSTLYICWAAQAALFHHYRIGKIELPRKMFGVFEHRVRDRNNPLMRGFDDAYYIPVSRHTAVNESALYACPDLNVLAVSEESGVGLVASRDGRRVFATGHSEYDADTLDKEYRRDLAKGMPIEKPRHYYPADDDTKPPMVRWRSHASLLFQNWLNYFVYQETPYDLGTMQPVAASECGERREEAVWNYSI
ncbi:MAG: homoserine O-succinyltransferase [Oscillospiraceae bacterium]|jgi:homoserine O-succinyltransferase|nr:homoserine O-succinyltransferase [Oscillospiraceae bacterium]